MPKQKKLHKNKLSNKFRFSIFNDTSHEELFAFRANGKMFILTAVLAVIFLIIFVSLIISYTPIKQMIPGYPSAESRRELVHNAIKLDSLQNEVNMWKDELTNIQKIATGQEPGPVEGTEEKQAADDSANSALRAVYQKDEESLKQEVEKQTSNRKKAAATQAKSIKKASK
ncbi:MAG: hypothetical protein WCQ81_01410 [Bacteroidales bacterium]